MTDDLYRPQVAPPLEPAAAPLALASRGARLGATTIDLLGLALALGPGSIAIGIAMGYGKEMVLPLLAVSLVLSLLFVGGNLWLMRNGQTIGKRMLGIRAVRSNGEPLSLARYVLLRVVSVNLIAQVPILGTIFTLVDALFIFRDDQRCIHDHIADTIVVRAGA